MTEAGRIQKHPMVLLSTHVLAGVHTSGVLMLGAVLGFREGLKIQVSQKNKLGGTLLIKKGCRICLYLVDEDDILSSFSSMRGNFLGTRHNVGLKFLDAHYLKQPVVYFFISGLSLITYLALIGLGEILF